MIPTKRNHFYTKEIITNAVGVRPQFKDLSVGNAESTLTLNGGLGATEWVVSGNVSETPFPNMGELVGGFLQTYVTGMSLSGTSSLPSLYAYKIQNGFPISEGGFTLATGTTDLYGSTSSTIGDALWVSSSQFDSGEVWLEETFDGSNKSMGSKLVLPGGGNAAMTMEDAYVKPKEGAEAITFGGDAFFGGGGSNDIERNLSKYFSLGGPSGTGSDDKRIYVRPKSKNRIEGLWTAIDDHRNDKQKWQIYEPYWKWDAIKPILRFGKVDPADGTLPDGDASPHNTIFNKIWKDNATLSGWDMPEGNLLNTTMTLVPSQDGGEGQSLRIYSDWWRNGEISNNLYSVLAKTVAVDYQKTPFDPDAFSTPIQTSWASIYDLPYPIPQDVGGLAQTLPESGNRTHGDQRMVMPEININMKIAQLLSSPTLDLSNAAAGTTGICYGDVDGTAGYTSATLSSMPYHNKTFWRSVVITFSNYTPEEVGNNCTMDEFIRYGLDYAYGVKTADGGVEGQGNLFNVTNRQLGPKIVTGLVFSAFYGASGGSDDGTYDDAKNKYIDNNSIYAYTLPVTAAVSGNASNSKFGLWANKGGDTPYEPPSTLLHCPIIGPLTGSSRENFPYVKVPRDEFFNLKFVFDVQQPWSKDTHYGWYMEENVAPATDYGSNSESGVPIRAYFDTLGLGTTSGASLTDLEAAAADKKKPYINLALPAYDVSNNSPHYYMCWMERDGTNMQTVSTRSYVRGTPEHFPRHMTIWVNNFTFAPIGDGTPPAWGNQTTWFDEDYWVSDEQMWPQLTSAGAISDGGNWQGPNPVATELLIDSIKFKYWNSPITQNSAGAGMSSRFFKGEKQLIPTPVARVTEGSEYGTGFSANGYIQPIAPGQYFTIGYKDWDWFNVVGGAGTGGALTGSKSAYMLANNFSSKQFGLMNRATPTAAWISDGGTSDDGAQSYFAGYSMFADVEGSASGVSGTATQSQKSKVFVTSGSTVDPETTFGGSGAWPGYEDGAYMCMGYDGDGNWLSTDGLTQKGFMKLTLSSGSNSMPWAEGSFGTVARENPLTSAKIISVAGYGQAGTVDSVNYSAGGDNLIAVDDIDIFQEDLDDEYIIYRAGWYQDGEVLRDGPDVEDPFTDATCVTTADSTALTLNTANSSIDLGMSVSGAGIPANTYITVVTDNSTYVLSRQATASADPVTLTFNRASNTALGYKHTVKLLKKDMGTNTVSLKVTSGSTEISTGILKADDDMTDLCVPSNLYSLYISPKRYWFNMMFAGEDWTGERQYENFCFVGETPATGSVSTQLGSAYNEAQYSYDLDNMETKGMAAAPIRPWILGVDDKSSLILNQDYGYGSYDDEKNEGGEASEVVPVLNTETHFDLRKMVDTTSPGPLEEVSLILGLEDEVSDKSVTLVGDDTALDVSGSTYYRPQYVWEYYDQLPEVKKFRIEPSFDVLSPDINLYELTKQPINNLKFKWDESAEDVWYRHLIISPSGAIENKYHECSFWAPLNESDVDWSSTWHKYYTTNTSGMAAKDLKPQSAISTTKSDYIARYQPVINGLSGYATWRNSNAPGLSMIDSGTCATTGSYKELTNSMYFDMSTGAASTAGDNPWAEAWSLVIHCNPNNQDAAATTKTQGMTVCGVAQMAGAMNSGTSSNAFDFTPTINQGNVTLPASGAMNWNTWATTPSIGGFDLLHVYIKDNKVFCQYNHEYRLYGDNSAPRPFAAGAQYEGLLLSSSTNYALDGTENLSITLIWDEKLGADVETSSSILNNEQFRMYINGQLEDSTSTTLGATLLPPSIILGPSQPGGFGRSNYSKFVIGAFDTTNASFTGGVGPGISNIAAGVGSDPSSITASGYDNRVNGYHGTIEEIILYPYALVPVPNAGEFELVTRGIPDYNSTGSTGTELNYNARLFVYDYTNVRGKSSSEVASSPNVQWKVTGV